MKEKLRIAIYSRKSKFSEKGESVGNQVELCKEYISLHYLASEYDIETDIYEDEGWSGGTLERPQFQEFMKVEQSNPYNILICYRLDRISRNIADFTNLITELSKLDTSFISIKEKFDTKTPMGRAMMFIASVFAQLEREVIAERIRDNMLELSKTGRWLGGDAPTGYSSEKYELVKVCEKTANNILESKTRKACKLVTNEDEKDIVITIFNKYMELKSLSQLEVYLLKNSIKSRHGKDYCIPTIRQILTNPVYVKNDKETLNYYNQKGITIYAEDDRNNFDGKYGLISYNKMDGVKKRPMDEWVIAVGLHEGFIDGKDWVKVQELLEKNSDKRYRATARSKNNAVFSGILKCKCCGSYMRPKSGTSKDANGKTKYYYSCVNKEKSRGHNCNSRNVYGNDLDNNIIEEIKKIFVPNSEVYKELKKMQFSKNDTSVDEINSLEKKLNKNNEETKAVIDKMKYIDASLMDVINAELKRLKEKEEKLTSQIEEFKKKSIKENNAISTEAKTSKFILDIIDNALDEFNNFDLKYKKDLLNIFIESAVGEGDTVEIKLLNTKIDESKKKGFYATYLGEHKKMTDSLSSDSTRRCANIRFETNDT